MIKGTDIGYYLSGGTNNTAAFASLGGDPSSTPVHFITNSVFTDVSTLQSQTGLVDYRCIYVWNNNETDSLYNTQVFIQSEVQGGSSIQIGLPLATDVQTITIMGTPPTGFLMTLYYDTKYWTGPIAYDSNYTNWAHTIQNALNNLFDVNTANSDAVLSGVQVSADFKPETSNMSQTLILTIIFSGADDNTSHPLLTESDNLNTFPGTVSVVIDKITQGGPINTIADRITNATIKPAGVLFSYPTQNSPIVLGELRPYHGFPVWIQRTTKANPNAMSNDGFILAVGGSPIS